MYHQNQFQIYKSHLLKRYLNLIETSINYKYEDEALSDMAAFKAMKLLEKLNQVRYLDREVTI